MNAYRVTYTSNGRTHTAIINAMEPQYAARMAHGEVISVVRVW